MSQVFGVLLVLSGSSVAKKQLVGPVPQQMQGASNTVNHPPLHRVEKDNVTMPSQNEHRLDPDDPGGITDKGEQKCSVYKEVVCKSVCQYQNYNITDIKSDISEGLVK